MKEDPQYLYSALNNPMLNYRVYVMSSGEMIMYSLLSFCAGGLVGLIFYGGLFKENGISTVGTTISNLVVFAVFGYLARRLFIPLRKKQLKGKRQQALKVQFRDLLESLSTSFSSGMNVRDSFAGAYEDMKTQYPDDAFIVAELKEIMSGLENNIAVEDLLRDFGERSENEDILSFSDVFEVCFRKGGNIKDVVRRTHAIIGDKMTIADEIETKLTSNKTQQKIMNVMPIVIVAVLKYTNESFAENFATAQGVFSVTIGIVIFVFAYFMGEKIVDVKG